ncbi:GlsB/YeaQ/YmgE family stress response membrane protein [Planctopirus hydrillae]|nr:GlsB/YeaQ/YmgE family stress response membrane protein [Planctopirus hydrillae]
MMTGEICRSNVVWNRAVSPCGDGFPMGMLSPELMLAIEQAAHEMLMWVGFGTLVGLCGKAIMPGKDPGGAVGTVCIGISGSVIGCGSLLLWDSSLRISPISISGFIAATAGAFALLLFYRILSNSYFIVEAVDGGDLNSGERVTYRRRRRTAA